MLAVIITESTIPANLVVGLFPVVAFRYGYISKLSIKDRDLHNPNFCTKFGRPYFAIFPAPNTCSKSNHGQQKNLLCMNMWLYTVSSTILKVCCSCESHRVADCLLHDLHFRPQVTFVHCIRNPHSSKETNNKIVSRCIIIYQLPFITNACTTFMR